MVQIKKVRGQVKKTKHEPLHRQIQRDYQILPDEASSSNLHSKQTSLEEISDQEESSSLSLLSVDPATSQKILRQSREQLAEIQQETSSLFSRQHHQYEDSYDSEIDDADYPMEDLALSHQDLALLEAFEARNSQKSSQPLSDLILNQLNNEDNDSQPQNDSSSNSSQNHHQSSSPPLNPRVQEAFEKVGLLLSRYRSGKLPKAFKVIPALPNWEQILQITQPSNWTPQALYQAARIFCSNLKALRAQRFLELVMLPRFLHELRGGNGKKLNVHTFQALKKATYKPAAFYKGLVFPLLRLKEGGGGQSACSLHEANALCAVLKATSIPALHSAAAILGLISDGPRGWTGAKALVLRTLLDKKYALPLKVLEALVDYFAAFAYQNGESFPVAVDGEGELPVLWHQGLLVFVQRFKAELTVQQRKVIVELVSTKGHYQIGPEVLRELQSVHQQADGDEMRL